MFISFDYRYRIAGIDDALVHAVVKLESGDEIIYEEEFPIEENPDVSGHIITGIAELAIAGENLVGADEASVCFGVDYGNTSSNYCASIPIVE